MKFSPILLAILPSIQGLSVDVNPSSNNPGLFKGLEWPKDITKFVERIVGQWVLDSPDQLPDNANKFFSQLDSLYNTEDAPCNPKYWNQKLKGSKRDGDTIYILNDKKTEVKRKAFLGNCEILTNEINPDRLIFYFKDDMCKEFDFAKCQ